MGILDAFGGNENMDEKLPAWEEYGVFGRHTGKMSLADIDRKWKEGWALLQIVPYNNKTYFYFLKKDAK